ncbi:MAG TPA: alkaline phosphatase family protein [Candidatus Limnocylindrales bacterium]|nr:alkaline phosphatase family protein [Candidatus Limnocylindrales bacterium]
MAKLSCSIAVAVGVAWAVAAAPALAGPTSVVLVSWDGARYDVVQELLRWQPLTDAPLPCPAKSAPARMPTPCGPYWSCLPTLCTFQMVESAVVSGKPLTRVQHASMLSGQPPEITGVTTNNGGGTMPPGLSIYERLHARRGDVGFAHVGSIRYTVTGILAWARDSVIAPGFIQSRGGPDNFTGTAANEQLFPLLQSLAGSPFFAFQHQKGIDWSGHRIGDGSPQYREAMMHADDRLAELLEELERLGEGDTDVYVTTDHGFQGRTHLGRVRRSVARTWFASRKRDLRCFARGDVLDVAPTVLHAFGIDPASEGDLGGRSFLDPARVAKCTDPTCGNGIVEPGEDCEGGVTAIETCETLGFLRGSLGCTADCAFDTSECADGVASARLSLRGSDEDTRSIDLRLTDRNRGGPEVDPKRQKMEVTILEEGQEIWRASIDAGDQGWRADAGLIWSAPRGSRADGLDSVRMSDPDHRMKLMLRASEAPIPADFGPDAVRVVLRVGAERLEMDMTCLLGSSVGSYDCESAYDEELALAAHADCAHAGASAGGAP